LSSSSYVPANTLNLTAQFATYARGAFAQSVTRARVTWIELYTEERYICNALTALRLQRKGYALQYKLKKALDIASKVRT